MDRTDYPPIGAFMMHNRLESLIGIFCIVGLLFLASPVSGDTTEVSVTAEAFYAASGAASPGNPGTEAQTPPEPGRHGVTDTDTTIPTATPTTVPDTTTTPSPSPTPTSTETVPPSTSIPVQEDAGTGTSVDAGYALLAGVGLGSLFAILESRKRLLLLGSERRGLLALVFTLIAIGIVGSILSMQGIGQSWLLIVPVLQAGMFCTSIALVGSYLAGIRLPTTTLFQGTGSTILVIIILITLVQHGQSVLSPYALLLYGGSAAFSFWQWHIQERSRSGVPAEPTLTLSAADPHPVALAMAEKYHDVELIAVGGLARVYRARRNKDNRIVAVKVPLTTSEATGTSFMKEILVWQSLSHPNIVSITDATILPFPAVEMEYIPRSLADVKKPLDIPAAVPIITGIAQGLAYAHDKGVIHRDIKPENILITADGIPKITDWGMSRILAAQMPTVVGFSVSYAAPEQVSPSRFGTTDGRTDIFQLGVVFYELVTGLRPFRGEDSGEIIDAILNSDPIPPSRIIPASKIVEPIILTCIAKKPEDRYQSVPDLLADLEKLELHSKGS